MRSCIYFGFVSHRRTTPVAHRFRYRLPIFYLDLDELPALHQRLRLLSVNAPNLMSFHDADHVDARPIATKAKITQYLQTQGIDLAGGKVFLLTQCRLLHYVFNPVSFHFCHGADGALRAIVAEVNNTFGERYLYALSDENRLPSTSTGARYRATKAMHVSPFLSRDGEYEFSFHPVGDALAIAARVSEHGRPCFAATVTGVRRPLSDRTLIALLLRHPLLTHKITAAIHWQALRLYWKGAPFHRQPAPTRQQDAQHQVIHQLTTEIAP
jgi:DUF1365 family protein